MILLPNRTARLKQRQITKTIVKNTTENIQHNIVIIIFQCTTKKEARQEIYESITYFRFFH